MTVDTFDPGALGAPMDETAINDACRAGAASDGETVSLSELDVRRLAPLLTHDGWAERASTLDDEQLVALVRLFTLGERDFSGWQAGEKSAVIPLVRELKSRGVFSKALNRWVKTHTDNKFLPHGSLADLL